MAKSKKDQIIDRYAQGMFVRQDLYASRVRSLYDDAVTQLLALANQIPDLSSDKKFYFADNPRVGKEATRIIRELYTKVYIEVKNDCTAEWQLANLSCDKMIQSAFGWKLKDRNVLAKWWDRNQSALDQFFARKAQYGGLNLSQKVWKYTGDLRTEMENAITVSLGEADTAQEMSRKVRQYLQYPDKLFRRVRGADGKLHLSANAKAFHPSRGVYRSSYKNAMRLARTETNAAYRAADEDRWQRMDFVVGFEVKKSNNHPEPDICDDLAGKYPKDFKFTAWHPQCRCYVVPILAQPDELLKMQQAVLAGKNPSTILVEKPDYDGLDKINTWIKNNHDRILRASAKPYWIVDNFKYGNVDKGLKFDVHTKTPAEAAKLRHQNRDAKKISDAWHEHKMQEIQTRISDADIEVNEAMQGRINALKSAFTSGDNAAIQAAFKKAISGIETQAKWDKIVWEGFTPEQKKNLREFGNTIGVKKGRRMTHEQADSGKVNPLYQPHYLVDPKGHYVDKNHVHYSLNPKYEKGYTINCQTCAPVYTLRRWGFNIEAKPNNKSDAFKYMARHSHEFWTNTDGSVLGGKGVHATTKKTEMFNWLDQQPDGTYQIACTWKGAKSGHTFSYVKEGGVGHFYDPQSNRLFKDLNDFREYSDSVSPKYGWRFWKVENRGVNIARVKDLIETKIHPIMTREERIKEIAVQRHAKRDAQKLQEAWTQRRLENARKQVVEITKEVNSKFDSTELHDLHVRVRSVYNAIKQGKTPQEVDALLSRVKSGVQTKLNWETRKQHNLIKKTAENVISNSKDYPELAQDIAKLQSMIDASDYDQTSSLAKALADKLSVIKQKQAEFAKVIPHMDTWSKTLTTDELQGVYDAVQSKFAQWSSLTLEMQSKKLNFEANEFLAKNMHNVQAKFPKTWKVSQAAYLQKLDEVNTALEFKKLDAEYNSIKGFKTKSVKFKEGLDKYLEAVNKGNKDDAQFWLDYATSVKTKLEEQAQKKAEKELLKNAGKPPVFKEEDYSQARKDAAMWAQNGMESYKELAPQSAAVWNASTQAERNAIYAYTYTYHNINEPLRGLTYFGSKADTEAGLKRIPLIEKIISKTSLKNDCWFHRGGGMVELKKFGLTNYNYATDDEIKALVGKEGTEGAFMSVGSSKGHGFPGSCVFNIYCPKGTKGMYVEPFSKFGNGAQSASWDGKCTQTTVGGENETLLQRGTKFRITKAEKGSNGTWYIDMEVIEQKPVAFPYVGGYPFL
jgi:hypothetical protein